MEVNLETRSLDPSKISFQPFNPLESRCLGGSENTYVGSNFFTIFFFLTSLHTSFSQKIPRRDFVRIPSPPPLLLQNWFTRDFHEARRRQLSTRSGEQPEINVFASAEKSPLFGGEGFGEHVIENAEIYRIFLGGTTRRTICCSKLWKQFDTNSKSCKKHWFVTR